MIQITDTANWLEVAALLVTLIGLTVSIVNLRAAYRVRTLLHAIGVNGVRRMVSRANVDGEQLRLAAQGMALLLVVNALTLPSRYGWQSVASSAGLLLISLMLAGGSLVASRLRRNIIHGEE